MINFDQRVDHPPCQNAAPYRVLHVLNSHSVEALLCSAKIQIATVHRPLWEIRKGRPEASLDTMDFAPMSIDELSKLHETVAAVLAKKIAAEIILSNDISGGLAQQPISFSEDLNRQKPRTRGVGPIPRSCQSIAIQRDHQKHRPAAEGNRSG
jgi:hypothetical protein